MNPILKKTLLWLPRVFGILFVLFTSLFSFDVFDMGLSLWESIFAFFMHLLVPTMFLTITVSIAWRWEWVGALGFGLWGVYYYFSFGGFDLNTFFIIGGIPLLIAAFYLTGWIFRKEIRA